MERAENGGEDGGRIGGPYLGLPHPMNQIDSDHIMLNTQKLTQRYSEKNSTTKRREEATTKKVGSAESQFGREIDHGHCGRVATVAEKGERDRLTHEGGGEHIREMNPYSNGLRK